MTIQGSAAWAEAVQEAMKHAPLYRGHSRDLFALDAERYLVRLRPSLSSFTFSRYEDVAGTEITRLDFFEMAVERLQDQGIGTAFLERIAPDAYIAQICNEPPIEVIVKNFAGGSTQRKYPGLFPDGHRFGQPIVKFDFRVDPEDQPIADDYVRELGYPPAELKMIALQVNDILRRWLSPRILVDFCVILGRDPHGRLLITSEISPDSMRLRTDAGDSLDKDLFRHGAPHEHIQSVWRDLVTSLRATS